MAGGTSRRRDPETLAQRSARSGRGEAPEPPSPPTARHCWVNGPRGRLPGLLLGWERSAGGWRGRVVHLVLEDGAWHVVEEWLPAEVLEPPGQTD